MRSAISIATLVVLSKRAWSFLEIVEREEIFPSRTAQFGPRVNDEGQSGWLIPIDWVNFDDGGDGRAHADDAEERKWGCKPVDKKVIQKFISEKLSGHGGNTTTPQESHKWIAMVKRGKCSFMKKTLAMQASGAEAIIVGDDRSGPLLKMYPKRGEREDGLRIPSLFIQQWEYRDLKYEAMDAMIAGISPNHRPESTQDEDSSGKAAQNQHSLLLITVFTDQLMDMPIGDLITVAIVALMMLIMLIFAIWKIQVDEEEGDDFNPWLLRDHQHQLRSSDLPAPSFMVDALPTIHFHCHDTNKDTCITENTKNPPNETESLLAIENLPAPLDQEMCTICLDPFSEGQVLRMLPCKHVYCVICIDSWLLTRRRTCPVCMADCCKGLVSMDGGALNENDLMPTNAQQGGNRSSITSNDHFTLSSNTSFIIDIYSDDDDVSFLTLSQ